MTDECEIPDGIGNGGRRRVLDYLLQNVGVPVSTADLYEVSGGQVQYSRRLRELRNEFGYVIDSNRDDATIPIDHYVLRSATPSKYAFRRKVSAKVRARVLARNGATCQSCGVTAGETHPDTRRRTVLQLGHVKDKAMGGSDDEHNLIVLCSLCNQGASDIMPQPTDATKLLTQVRKGNREAQLKVLKWLKTKFEQK